VDRFDAYASQKLAEQIHGTALRQAAHDRLGRQATGERPSGKAHVAWPSMIHSLPPRSLIEATHLPRFHRVDPIA
jgi:hypothetical protein